MNGRKPAIQRLFTPRRLSRPQVFCVKVGAMRRVFLPMVLMAAAFAAAPASAQMLRDQDEAFAAARNGEIRPLGEILGRVAGRVPGNFIGSDYDAARQTYRLKYMQNGRVRYIDVDARTGAVIGRSGN